MKHIVEFNTVYRMGHQLLITNLAVLGRNINSIESVLEEIPSHRDGARTRVTVVGCEPVYVTMDYTTALEQWKESVESL